jgi:cell division protein FtsI/penicillin-binding protein 2
MARALGTLANHGLVPSPHVVVALDYPGEPAKKPDTLTPVRAISAETADTVTTMLVQVVDKALRGGTVRVPELSIAAKTGTAQIADPSTHGYYTDRYLHSFFGYFPAYNARFLVFFYAVAPQGAKYASETWTNPFMESVRFLMTYYGVQPDRAPTQQ